MMYQSIPEQVREIPSVEERSARAYVAWQAGCNAAHTIEWDFYMNPGFWNDGKPSRHWILTAELNRRGLNR